MSREELMKLYRSNNDFRRYVDAFAKDFGKESNEVLDYVTVKGVAEYYAEQERSK